MTQAMANKSDLPSFEKYFPPAVQAMKQRGGSTTNEEFEEDVAKIMKLPESILAIPHKNGAQSQFQYELAWVRTYLKKAGLAENSARGIWTLTDVGEKIAEKDLLLVPKKVRWLKKPKDQESQSQLEGEEAEEPDWQQLTLSILATIKPDAFERLSDLSGCGIAVGLGRNGGPPAASESYPGQVCFLQLALTDGPIHLKLLIEHRIGARCSSISEQIDSLCRTPRKRKGGEHQYYATHDNPLSSPPISSDNHDGNARGGLR
jgi:hypothetical protein